MSILINKDSRVIVQGITGSEGSFHAEQCYEYGKNILGGVTPGKGGQRTLPHISSADGKEGLPVFNTCREAVIATKANVSLIFVPPPFAADAVIEAAECGIPLIVCITEGIPVKDMIKVESFLSTTSSRLIGPNCPGLLTPNEAKVGIMPGSIAKKGNVGVISKSGTLTYEAVDQLVKVGLGQTTCIGIGGDPIIGTDMVDLVDLFERDPETEAVVIIGEIGGSMELEVAKYIKDNVKKPVTGFIAGQTAPPGRRMGHAGAIVSGVDESAEAKKKIMQECGVHVVNSPAEIGLTVKKSLG